MLAVQAGALVGLARLLEAAGVRVGLSRLGAGFGGAQAPAGEIERVPAQPDAMRRRQHQDDDDHGGEPGRPRSEAGHHGKAFRSSSKWGPSRSLGQSPPQTIAVP